MSYQEYVQQLEQVNIALECCTEENKEGLLSLKQSLEEIISLTSGDDTNLPEPHEENNENVDDEYALFMAEINEVSRERTSVSLDDGTDSNDLKEMEGKRCRAPHINKWGSKGYHNAMICSVIPPSSDNDEAQVTVLFVNPTHEEMLPCPYYFDTDCKFSDEKCKFSHGETVSISDILEYIEPDFASLKIGSSVLAQQNNKLWGRAKITHIMDDTCMVRFETVKKDMELPFKEILPMENDESSSEDESSEEKDVNQVVIDMSLMNTPSDCRLGDWEKFTKGIGSKLMEKMGYVVGTGLGKRSDGRIDPVPAVVLPPGKSLDHCMKLREQHGGDKNLFSAEKKMKRQQKKQELKNQRAYEKEENKQDVFTFLNHTLTNKPSSSASFSKKQHRQEIQKESGRNLNVEGLKIDENIKKTEDDIVGIKQSLSRHKDSNSEVHKGLKHKLNLHLSHLNDLKEKAQNIKNEQDNRRDKKKLTVF